jgi:hypothetical protein
MFANILRELQKLHGGTLPSQSGLYPRRYPTYEHKEVARPIAQTKDRFLRELTFIGGSLS